MIHPDIYLGGTSKEQLVEDWSKAYAAVKAAQKALIAAGPNARDFHPQGPGAFKVAIAEHRMRVIALEQILWDLDELREHAMKY